MIEPLFQIQISHGYFSSGVFENCRVRADADTQKLIDRYRLLSRMNNGVFEIYTVFQEGAAAFIRYLNDQMSGGALRFLLASSQEQFVCITDLPLDWVGQVMLSSKSTTQDKAEGGIRLSPMFSDRIVGQDGVIGVISIFPDDLLAMKVGNIRYVVDFKVRATHWQYCLINRSKAKLNNPMICNQQRVCLEGPVPTVLPNGEHALRFSSGEMQFPVQQVPDVAFDLIDSFVPPLQTNGKTVERCLIKGLPTPKQGQFDIRQSNANPYVFSEMYVYL